MYFCLNDTTNKDAVLQNNPEKESCSMQTNSLDEAQHTPEHTG